ncbi:hypothetical protein MPHO_49530 [Mycolicibacterium phocaicum]|nr:hypothetical protein MPHO_49530 [Mycolicibacterium phocaicum]
MTNTGVLLVTNGTQKWVATQLHRLNVLEPGSAEVGVEPRQVPDRLRPHHRVRRRVVAE